MTAEITSLAPADLEQLIVQVRGVHAVRLVASQDGNIDEVHVVGTPARTAKQIVRDIESILYVRGRVRVDHRKISLVQIADVVASTAPRLQFVAVRHESTAEATSVTVTLRLRDREAEGLGTSRPGQPADVPLLAAYATIHAIGGIFGQAGQVYLERLQRQPFGDLEVYLAQITREVDGVAEILMGVSVMRDDELSAVVRAVLDAVNRRLERLVGGGKAAARA